MIDFRIDVGIEAVLVGVSNIPRAWRLFFHQADLDDRLDALETVLPRHDEPEGCAVLRGKSFAIEADRQQGEWIHGFIEPKAFDIRQLDSRPNALGHLLSVVVTLEGYILRLRSRLHVFEQRVQRIADPWNHDRPGFDATVPVDAL